MLTDLRAALQPAMYHGHHRAAPFFEGWYYKLIGPGGSPRLAVIPGIFKGPDSHAFIQVLDGWTGKSQYHSFSSDSFWASRKGFEIRIAENIFDAHHLFLKIERPEQLAQGEVFFHQPIAWPGSLLWPGIMGPYSWAPFMECYHGVVSLDHAIAGQIDLDGERLAFDGGRGYTEKDWGQAFPAAWVWFQSNHFANAPGASLTASMALIPWLGKVFPGFIVGLWHAGRLYRFASYSGARSEIMEISDTHLAWRLGDRRCRLHLAAWRAEGGLLRGPDRLEMGKRVMETLRASVEVRLARRDGQVLFQGRGECAGLEVYQSEKLTY